MVIQITTKMCFSVHCPNTHVVWRFHPKPRSTSPVIFVHSQTSRPTNTNTRENITSLVEVISCKWKADKKVDWRVASSPLKYGSVSTLHAETNKEISHLALLCTLEHYHVEQTKPSPVTWKKINSDLAKLPYQCLYFGSCMDIVRNIL